MSQVSMWVLSIVSIVLIGVLIEVILPQGKTNKILKSVVAVVSVLVIVSPLKNLDIDMNREKRDLKKFLSSRLLLCLML